MKLLRARISATAKEKQVPFYVVEKDYALSYILAGIYQEPTLAKTLVFKGGTALKKIYFGDYRFSEDLDFSTINAPIGVALEKMLQAAMAKSHALLEKHAPFQLVFRRKPEKAPHPTGQEAFEVGVQFPWHREPQCRVKLEITHDEPVLQTPKVLPLLHNYDEQLHCEISTYTLEEIVSEKLRALLQTHQKLAERGWNRPRARDYYDLWRISTHFGSTLQLNELPELLKQKSALRGVSFEKVNDFFTDELVSEAQKNWETVLKPFVKDLPPFSVVQVAVKLLISKIFSNLSG